MYVQSVHTLESYSARIVDFSNLLVILLYFTVIFQCVKLKIVRKICRSRLLPVSKIALSEDARSYIAV